MQSSPVLYKVEKMSIYSYLIYQTLLHRGLRPDPHSIGTDPGPGSALRFWASAWSSCGSETLVWAAAFLEMVHPPPKVTYLVSEQSSLSDGPLSSPGYLPRIWTAAPLEMVHLLTGNSPRVCTGALFKLVQRICTGALLEVSTSL